jgi:hypothetical protein
LPKVTTLMLIIFRRFANVHSIQVKGLDGNLAAGSEQSPRPTSSLEETDDESL